MHDQQSSGERSDITNTDQATKQEPPDQVSSSLYCPGAANPLGHGTVSLNGHSADTASLGYRQQPGKTGSAQKQMTANQAEYNMTTWEQQIHLPRSSLKLESPVFSPFSSTTAGSARPARIEGIHSRRLLHPSYHRACLDANTSAPFEPRFLGPPPSPLLHPVPRPFGQPLPPLRWQPQGFRPGHQLPLMCEDYIVSHGRDSVYASRRLDPRPFWGSGMGQGPAVYPFGAFPDHGYHPHSPSPHPWEATEYRMHGRGTAFSDVYEDEFQSQPFFSDDLARFPHEAGMNVYQYERCARGSRFLPGMAESYQPLSPGPPNSTALAARATLPACNVRPAPYTTEGNSQTQYERYATGSTYTALSQTANGYGRSCGELSGCSAELESWTVGVSRAPETNSIKQAPTQDVGDNAVVPFPTDGCGSGGYGSQEADGQWTKSCGESQDDVAQDYITMDATDLPLDVAEETVVTCNTVSGVAASDCCPLVVPYSSVENPVLMDTHNDTHLSCPMQDSITAKPFSDNLCAGPFSQRQADATVPHSAAPEGVHADRFGANQKGTLTFCTLLSTRKHPSSDEQNQYVRGANFSQDTAQPWSLPASNQAHEKTSVTGEVITADRTETSSEDNTNSKEPSSTDLNAMVCPKRASSSGSGDGEVRSRVLVQREERGDLTQLSSTSVQQLLSAALHTPGMEIVVDENYHPEKMALVIPKEKRQELNGCV